MQMNASPFKILLVIGKKNMLESLAELLSVNIVHKLTVTLANIILLAASLWWLDYYFTINIKIVE